MMNLLRSALTATAAIVITAGASVPAFAGHSAVDAAEKVLALDDGSTLYVFKDGKMAKEDRFGRAASINSGDVLRSVDGKMIRTVGNETARLDFLLRMDHNN